MSEKEKIIQILGNTDEYLCFALTNRGRIFRRETHDKWKEIILPDFEAKE